MMKWTVIPTNSRWRPEFITCCRFLLFYYFCFVFSLNLLDISEDNNKFLSVGRRLSNDGKFEVFHYYQLFLWIFAHIHTYCTVKSTWNLFQRSIRHDPPRLVYWSMTIDTSKFDEKYIIIIIIIIIINNK